MTTALESFVGEVRAIRQQEPAPQAPNRAAPFQFVMSCYLCTILLLIILHLRTSKRSRNSFHKTDPGPCSGLILEKYEFTTAYLHITLYRKGVERYGGAHLNLGGEVCLDQLVRVILNHRSLVVDINWTNPIGVVMTLHLAKQCIG